MVPAPGLRKARLAKMLTQVELAAASGVSRLAITRIEGHQATARFSTLKKLAAALNVDPRTLTGQEE
jgi:transcriptional regulator with XRE-family HTH domain